MNLKRWTLVLLAAGAVLAGTHGDAHAQEAGMDAAQPSAAEATEFDAYWAEQRQVRVLQRRMYQKDGDFQLSLFAGAIPNDPFLRYFPLGLRFGYWINEAIGVELSGAYIDPFAANSDLRTFLADRGEVDVFLRDEQLWRGDFLVRWSPIYGKFSFAGTKLAHFDWHLGGGFGVVGVRNPVTGAVNDFTQTQNEIKPEVVIATGWILHLNQRWALRWDFHQYIFQKDSGGVALPSEFSIGGSFFF